MAPQNGSTAGCHEAIVTPELCDAARKQLDNRAVMNKWGIRLGEVTLGFRKLRR